MSLLVRKPGVLTTVQDLGRSGWRASGINPGGAMDTTAARVANILLSNDENEAVLEMHFPAGEFEFECDTAFALAGGDLAARLNDRDLRNWASFNAEKGDILKFTERRTGSRAYLAVAGGYVTDEWLGSRSTNLIAEAGGYHGRKLSAGDRIISRSPQNVLELSCGPSIIPRYSRQPTLRVIAGPEFERLTALSERDLFNDTFTLTRDSNRMGFRLNGKPLFMLDRIDMVSAAVNYGTIQLLPDGQMVILMADHQTSGGYPRIAVVIAADIPLAAQLSSGDRAGFHLVSLAEAESAAESLEKDIRILKLGVRLAAAAVGVK